MIELTKENFDEIVTENPQRVLVSFWVPGCASCHMMEPVVEAVAESYPDVTLAKMNASVYPDVAWAFRVEGTPAYVLFNGGAPVDTIIGAVPAQRLHEMLSGEEAE